MNMQRQVFLAMADNVIAMQVELQGAEQTQSGLKKIGEALKNVGKSQEQTNSKTGLLSKAFGGLKEKFSGAGEGLKKAFRAGLAELAPTALVGGAAAAGIAVAKFAKDSVVASMDLEAQMNKVFTMAPGASQQMKQKMTRDVRDLAKQYGSSTADMTEAMYQGLSAGVSTDNIRGFLEVAQKGAKAGVTDVTTSVDALSSVVNAWGEKNINAAQASDIMFATIRKGKTSYEEMAHSISQVGPIAAASNVSFKDIGASVATLTAQGTPTAQAMTQMKAAFSEFSKGSTDASKAFKQETGKSFQQFMKEGGNLGQAMQIMEQHAQKTGQNINELFGSVEAGQFALATTGQNAKLFADNIKEMQNSQGATDQAFGQMDQGLSSVLGKLKAQAADAMISVGDAIAPGLASIGQAVLGAIPAIQQFFASFAQSAEGQAYIQAMKATWDGFMAQISAAWSIIVTIFNVLVSAVQSFASGFISGFGGVSAQTINLQQIIGSVFQFIAGVINWAWGFIGPIISGLAQLLGFVLGGAVKLLVEGFIKLGNVLSKVGGFFKKLFGGGDTEKAKKDMEELKKGMEEINKEAEKPAKKEVEAKLNEEQMKAQLQNFGQGGKAGTISIDAMLKNPSQMPQPTQMPQSMKQPAPAQIPPVKIDPTSMVKVDPQGLANAQMKIDPTAFNGLQQAMQQVPPQINTTNSNLNAIKSEISSLKAEVSGLKASINGVKASVDGAKGAIVGKIGEIVGAIRAIKIDVKVPAGPSAGDIANRIAGSLQK